MDSRFGQFTVHAFSKRVPGTLPTEEQRKKFKGADLSGVQTDEDIYSLLRESINSVFAAASTKRLLVLDTASHRARDVYNDTADAFDDAGRGIYHHNSTALKAIAFDEKCREKRKVNADAAAERSHAGRRSVHWLAIPIVVKHDIAHTAFYLDDSSETPRAAVRTSQQEYSAQASFSGNSSEQTTGSVAPDAPPPTDEHPPADASFEGFSAAPFIQESAEGKEALVQFTECLLNVFESQHRLFSYAIYVWRHRARLCIFDRGGAIVCDAFDWTTPHSPLHDFIWKVANMMSEGRVHLGYDPTVQSATKKDAAAFRASVNDSAVHEAIRPFVKNAVSDGYPIHEVTIIPMNTPPDEGFPDDPFPPHPCPDSSVAACDPPPPASSPPAEPQPRSFLIGRAHCSTDTLMGRCTRGYIAYDIAEARLCFLKDLWRSYIPTHTRPEHVVYERMARCGVTGIPTVICGGDVGGMHSQATMTQNLLNRLRTKWIAPRVHYRIATVEIGLPLENFKNFKELAHILSDVLYAHYQAWKRAKVLHRDISVANILINPHNRTGLLIDWDLSRVECELKSRESGGIGTWRFRSALSLRYPMKPHCLPDDLESFVHVFNYLVLKYHPVDLAVLHSFVASTYEEWGASRGIKLGGETKLSQFERVSPPFRVRRNNEALQNVINQIHQGCRKSYEGVDLDRMQTLYGVSLPGLEELPPAPEAPETQISRRSPRIMFPSSSAEASTATPTTSTHRDDVPKTLHCTPNDKTTPATPPASAAAADPCELKGFLSHHRYISKVLTSYAEGHARCDKYPDQFELSARLDGEPLLAYARSRAPSSENGCTTSTESDIAPNSGTGSVHTSHSSSDESEHTRDDNIQPCTVVPSNIAQPTIKSKRWREDDDDESPDGGDAKSRSHVAESEDVPPPPKRNKVL